MRCVFAGGKGGASANQAARRRGAALVESALVFVPCIAILLAVVDLGQAVFMNQMLTERVRGALRYGSLVAYNPTAIQNMVLYGQPDVPTPSRPAFGNLTPDCVTVSRLGANTSEDRILVRVRGFQTRFYTPYLNQIVAALPVDAVASFEYTF